MTISTQSGSRPLVCFAVKEEAQALRNDNAQVLITGMGRRHAEQAIRKVLAISKPSVVLTCGFAGALRPGLTRGTVLFDAAGDPELVACLKQAGAQPARFHCAFRVATSAREKEELRAETGADAVEMESEVIAAICREQQLPCATVRVVLDEAGEDLPLDFNAFMDEQQKLQYGKLMLALLRWPGKLGDLLRLQRQSRAAAEQLANVVDRAVRELAARQADGKR